MTDSAHRIDTEALAGALRDVAGEDAEQPLREGPRSVARLVRRLLASPESARKLVDAFTGRAIERNSNKEPPQVFGPVTTQAGTYEDPPLMFDPAGSPEFEATIDALVGWHDHPERGQGKPVPRL